MKAKRQEIVEEWYREQLKEAVPPLIAKWEPLSGREGGAVVRAADEDQVGKLQPPGTRRFASIPSLAKKPAECLEYIVVHEMVHLLEPTHNARFIALMDRFMPKWHFHRQALNRLPVRQEKWSY